MLSAPSKATAPALALALREWLPELSGRVIAVSETASLIEARPQKLPLGLVYSPGYIVSQWSGDVPSEIREEVVIELWQDAERFRASSGGSLPIFKYFDEGAVRDVLYARLGDWMSPNGGVLKPTSYAFDLVHENATAALVWKFYHSFRWCAPDDAQTATAVAFKTSLVPAAAAHDCCCEPSKPDCERCNVQTWSPA